MHVAFAGLIAAGLLSEHFDIKSVGLVLAVTAFIDFDTFIGLWIPGAHRSWFHNLWVPVVMTLGLGWDLYLRDGSFLRTSVGDWGVQTAAVTIVAVTVAHILLDGFYNGVNLLWPVHDQFYDLSGQLLLTNQRGLVQTFIEFESTEAGQTVAEETTRGTTADMHYRTGVDPGPNADADTERIFPLADRGELFVLTIAGLVVVSYRLWETHRA